jgi:hypothetical protein
MALIVTQIAEITRRLAAKQAPSQQNEMRIRHETAHTAHYCLSFCLPLSFFPMLYQIISYRIVLYESSYHRIPQTVRRHTQCAIQCSEVQRSAVQIYVPLFFSLSVSRTHSVSLYLSISLSAYVSLSIYRCHLHML